MCSDKMSIALYAAIIVVISNGVMCYVPHGHLDFPLLPKPEHFPVHDTSDLNDRSVYDPGVGKLLIQSHTKKQHFF